MKLKKYMGLTRMFNYFTEYMKEETIYSISRLSLPSLRLDNDGWIENLLRSTRNGLSMLNVERACFCLSSLQAPAVCGLL
mmetsp:Transcript_3135/g.7552  ORF Transcript_3135/g.7552 Transcript_3135/m.7552 type:complete len:80 (-) Transcript_3135:558-797(-)